MNNLEQHVRNKFKGILVISDLHANLAALSSAIRYSEDHNLFLLSLGDLVDRGRYPFECVSALWNLMNSGSAGLIIGNHDNKFHKLHIGKNVSLSGDATNTLNDVGEERKSQFLRMYFDLQTNPILSGMFQKISNIVFVHAASHTDIWESEKLSSSANSRLLYGEVTGEMEADGMPIRFYNWISEIPTNIIVMVGHDRKPIHNVLIAEPLIVINDHGGKAIFIDTGCGKGGFLTGAVIREDINSVFSINEYVTFRDNDEIF